MGVFWERDRRGGRSSRRLLGHFLDGQYGKAEGVLGAVAVVLVLWLLWPEDSGPQLDQQAAWQQSVEEAERRRIALEAERGAGRSAAAVLTDATDANEEASAESEMRLRGEGRIAPVDSAIELERRRIARPSELADRLDDSSLRPFQPGLKRPPASSELAAAAQPAPTEATPREPGLDTATVSASDGAPNSVHAALADVVGRLQANVAGTATATTGLSSSATEEGPDDSGERPAAVAVLSSEALDAEPLPEVDLSDLDTLVPEEEAEPTSIDTAALDHHSADHASLDQAGLTSSPDAAIEPFAVEPSLSVPTIDVTKRPRDDAPTWLQNAVTAAVADDRPIIAVVIDDLGLNRSNTAEFNGLPAPLTLAFLPYAGRIEAQTEAAQAAGHELMLHLPMEPLGSDWPGPDALTTKIDQEEFTARLIKNLDRFEGFVGINNHMGSRLTADRSRMDVVMRELRKRDVLFLDSKTSSRSVAGDTAGQNGVPNTTRDIFLDNVIDVHAIRRQLARAERVARQSGSAVAIGHPHGATIQALRDWLPRLEERGFTLAPISAVVARRACSSGVLIAAETCGRYLQARKPAEPSLAAKDG